MADAILSVVLERLAATAEDKIRGEVSLARGVKEEVVELSNKLQTIRNVLEDAERKGVKEKSVRGWLKKLEDTAYEMEDILDEWNYYAFDASIKEKVRFSFIQSSFKKVAERRDIAKKIQNVKASLDKILKEKNDFNFAISSSTMSTTDSTPQLETTSSIDVEKVEGKDVERIKNDIVGKLMIDGDRQQVLCIVGMAGIGKTTLAQLVYNDSRVENSFDLRIWVCVSDPFDVAEVARRIIEIVEKQSPKTNQLDLLLQRLGDCISGKKFLLVLDDVWMEEYNKWEPLKINLKRGAASSKILVSTRNDSLEIMMGKFKEIYRPQPLTDYECWSLLRRISLRGKEDHRVFEEVGKKLVSKCKGLPLAVNILGKVLLFKKSLEEWEHVLESENWELDVEVEFFSNLFLSYNKLSFPLKCCFSYCAVYPKDFQIDVDRLIEQWIAQGYLGSIIDPVDLKQVNQMLSLFLEFEKSGSGKEIKWCRMHPMVHDFAQSLRKNDRVHVREKACQICDPSFVSHAQKYQSLFWDKESPLDLCDCLASLKSVQI